jgi:hypothetical protein
MVGIRRIDDGIRARRGSCQNVGIVKRAMDRGKPQGCYLLRAPRRAHQPGDLVPRGGQRHGDRPADIA